MRTIPEISDTITSADEIASDFLKPKSNSEISYFHAQLLPRKSHNVWHCRLLNKSWGICFICMEGMALCNLPLSYVFSSQYRSSWT